MKIDSSSSQPSNRANRARRPAASRADASTGAGAERRDAIVLSDQARNVVQLPQQSIDRAQLVSQLRQQVDAGTYRPDAEAVARRIVEQFGS